MTHGMNVTVKGQLITHLMCWPNFEVKTLFRALCEYVHGFWEITTVSRFLRVGGTRRWLTQLGSLASFSRIIELSLNMYDVAVYKFR